MPTATDLYKFDDAAGYHHGRFPPANLDYGRLIDPLMRAASAVGRYDAVLSGLPNQELLLRPMRRQEAVISSRIEGTVATLEEVLELEASNDEQDEAADGHPRRYHEIIEVVSYVRALDEAQRMLNEGMPISGRVIRAAHRRIVFAGRGADKQPGEFRTDQNYIVDPRTKKVLFVPIQPEDLLDAFRALEVYMNDHVVNALLQTAISHVEFEALHPFRDGNGRLGRMLITLNLWHRGLISGPYFYVSGYFEKHRDEYIERLRAVSSDGLWTDWCIFFLRAIEAEANDDRDTAVQIVALYEDMKSRFNDVLASRWSINALDFIFANPIFRNSAFTSKSGIPKQTAARLTKRLRENGVLRTFRPAAGRRSAMYAFEPLLKIVRA